MKRAFISIITLFLLPALLFTGCKKEETISHEQRETWTEQGRDPYPEDIINEDGTRG